MASAMVKIYVDLVENDLRTLESVPRNLRSEVSDILNFRSLSGVQPTIQPDESIETETEGAV